MKVINISVLSCSPGFPILTQIYRLNHISFFQKKNLKEILDFLIKLCVEKTNINTYEKYNKEKFFLYIYREDNLASVLVTDDECPTRIAQTQLKIILQDFAKKFLSPSNSPNSVSISKDNIPLQWPELEVKLIDIQKPDKLTEIKKDLDETKVIINDSLDKLIDREITIDELIEKTEELSVSSKSFYKQAKKHNKCCVIS